MARGPSGKLVIEVDPALKDALHARLAAEKTTLKDWFIQRAEEYLRRQQAAQAQPTGYRVPKPLLLKLAEPAPRSGYKARAKGPRRPK